MEAISNFHKFEKYVYECSKSVKRVAVETLDMSLNYIDEKGKHHVSQEDLIQQGKIWLWEAVNIYPAELEKRKKENEEIIKYNENALKEGIPLKKVKTVASMSTYVYLYLRSMYLNLNAKSLNMKNINKEFIDEFIDCTDDEEEKLASSFCFENQIDSIFVKEIYEGLSGEKKEVFKAYYLENLTTSEIKSKFPLYNNIENMLVEIKRYIELRRGHYENCRNLCWN